MVLFFMGQVAVAWIYCKKHIPMAIMGNSIMTNPIMPSITVMRMILLVFMLLLDATLPLGLSFTVLGFLADATDVDTVVSAIEG